MDEYILSAADTIPISLMERPKYATETAVKELESRRDEDLAAAPMRQIRYGSPACIQCIGCQDEGISGP